MRIIAGTAKGKKIFSPIDKKTRPLKDMVRESIFNIICHSSLLKLKLNQCKILDLFSGVGSFGLEAISRGVKKVVFFEDYSLALNLLNKNIKNLSFNEQAKIYKENIYKRDSFKKLNYKFNLIFIDPPFKDENLETIFDNLYKSKTIDSETIIILHRHKKATGNFYNNFKISREELYGSSKIIFGFFTF